MRVGILTSGGDCQGLNAALRAVAKSLYEAAEKNGEDIKIIGFSDGYKGLIYGEYSRMNRADFSGILTIGGTILGTSRQSFKEIRVIDEETGVDKVRKMKENYARLNLDCLVILGGNGSQKTANLLREEGLNIVSLAKTIDNDIYGTDISFGFQSACDIATNVIDCIHSTAYSHKRIFIVEIMGHKAGWLSLYAGIAGGADVILIPEIPYDLNKIIEVIKKRHQAGKKFTIIAVAEGAMSVEETLLEKDERKALRAEYPSVAYKISEELQNKTGYEIRVTVPGHFQRGGAPCPYDRVLCTRFGAAAAELILKKQYGCMVGIKNGETVAVPLEEVAGKLKSVPVDCEEVKSAKSIGISFGD